MSTANDKKRKIGANHSPEQHSTVPNQLGPVKQINELPWWIIKNYSKAQDLNIIEKRKLILHRWQKNEIWTNVGQMCSRAGKQTDTDNVAKGC